MNFILETFIFGEGVSEDAVAVVDDSLLTFDKRFLTLHKILLLLITLLPEVKFIRLSFCTFFLTK